MLGGFQQEEVTEEHNDLVNSNLAPINSILGVNVEQWKVDSVYNQFVGGTNYFFYLSDNSGNKYSVCIYVTPQNNVPPAVMKGYQGHVPPQTQILDIFKWI